MKIVQPSVTLEHITPNPLEVIERAGRTCYKSEPKGDPQAFVQMILRRGHESVLEHVVASFGIVCDRGISHEIVRHRLASYSQESTRYCNYGKDRFGHEIQVIEPPGLDGFGEDAKGLWEGAMETAEYSYLQMIKAGVAPQIARSVLPTCLKTELVMTANLREWRHFIKLREAPNAHPQIQPLARGIRLELEKHVGDVANPHSKG